MMNAVQMKYLKAKASYMAAKEISDELEEAFMAANGRKEKHVWGIHDNYAEFERLCNEFCETYKDEDAVLVRAKIALEKAENDLIAYGLSIIPKEYADILRSSKDHKVRKEMISITIGVDVSTVPKIYQEAIA
jgi:hypothetical protein